MGLKYTDRIIQFMENYTPPFLHHWPQNAGKKSRNSKKADMQKKGRNAKKKIKQKKLQNKGGVVRGGAHKI